MYVRNHTVIRTIASEMCRIGDTHLPIPTRVAALANIAERGYDSKFIPYLCSYCTDELLTHVPLQVHKAVKHAIGSPNYQEIIALSKRFLCGSEPEVADPPRTVDSEVYHNTILRLFEECALGENRAQCPLYISDSQEEVISVALSEEESRIDQIAKEYLEKATSGFDLIKQQALESPPLSTKNNSDSEDDRFWSCFADEPVVTNHELEAFYKTVDGNLPPIDLDTDSEADGVFQEIISSVSDQSNPGCESSSNSACLVGRVQKSGFPANANRPDLEDDGKRELAQGYLVFFEEEPKSSDSLCYLSYN